MSIKLHRHLLSEHSYCAQSDLAVMRKPCELVKCALMTHVQSAAEILEHSPLEQVMDEKFATCNLRGSKGPSGRGANIAGYRYGSIAPQGKVDLSVFAKVRTWFAYVVSLAWPVPFQKRTFSFATR